MVGNPALSRGFLSADLPVARQVYLNPIVGGLCEVLIRRPDRVESTLAPVAVVRDWAWAEGEDVGVHVTEIFARWDAPPSRFAGLPLDRTLVMGIVNVTPDSFSDGGETFDADAAVDRGLQLREEGADLIDVGGESSRPGALPVTVEEEIRRVVPVIRELRRQDVIVSIDTRRSAVMRAAIAEGAAILNDICALQGDPEALGFAVASGAPVVLMHMAGEPATMQRDPCYACVPLDIFDFLAARVVAAVTAGVRRGAIAVDPGLGFGKTTRHNLEILGRLGLYRGLGLPILLGASRKFGRLRPGQAAKERLAGSLAAALAGVERGANILRVHDVAETRQALAVWRSVRAAVES